MECSECTAVLPAEARFCLRCGTRVQAAPDPITDPLRDALERAIGFQYRIERLLGRGGMGAVYLAHELALERDVAIKVLPPAQAGTPQMRARFRQEARTAARLTHPNIVPLYTFGEVDGLMYFVMGYVPGDSLATRLRRDGALSSDTARVFLTDLAAALEYAHRQGIVHRDLKPDNILIDAASGAALLTDFGIARAPVADHLTMTGQIVGTPHYMSPEQARGQSDVDARSDLYSLGVMAYEMLAGRRPFAGESPIEALTQRLTQTPPGLKSVAPHVDDDLADAVMRCLEREPADRWPDALAFRAATALIDEGDDPLPIRLLRVGLTMGVVALLAAVYFGIFQGAAAAMGMLIGLGMPAVLIAGGAFIVARRQKLPTRAIGRLALLQPRWLRAWYPKRFRRRGDVWERLPGRIRQLRVRMTVAIGFMFFIALPTQLGLVATRAPQAARIAGAIVMFATLAFIMFTRTRMTRYVSRSLGVTAMEASRVMSLKSWQTALWQTGHASMLLRGEVPVSPPRAGSDGSPPVVAAVEHSTTEATRL